MSTPSPSPSSRPLLEENPPAHAYAGGGVPSIAPAAPHQAEHEAGQPNVDRVSQNGDRNDQADHGIEHGEREIDLPPMGTGVVILMGVILVALFAALFLIGWFPHHQRVGEIEAEAARKQNAKPIVDVTSPKRAKMLPALELPGATRAFQTTAVYPRAAGYLKVLHADIGDLVQAGKLLAEIETPEIDAQLAAANATLEQARANGTKAKSDLDLTQGTFARYEGFAKTGGVTQQQLEEKQSALEQAKSAVAAADATVRVDQAEVQRLTALQGFQRVYAPFTGTITARNYDVGALLSATTGGSGGSPLFQIDEVDMLRVFVDVPQAYSDQVKVGERASFIIRNFETKPFEGRIARTAGALDEQTRTLRVEADFPNKDGSLLPGMYGQVRYDLKQQNPPLLIPSSALIFSAEGTRVALVAGDNKIKFQPIEIGRDMGTELEIVAGLTGEERIVANPGERLADGVEVTVAPPRQQQQQQGQQQGSTTQPAQQQATNGRQPQAEQNQPPADQATKSIDPTAPQPTTGPAVAKEREGALQ